MESISMQVMTSHGTVWVSDKASYFNNWTGKAVAAARRHKIHGHA